MTSKNDDVGRYREDLNNGKEIHDGGDGNQNQKASEGLLDIQSGRFGLQVLKLPEDGAICSNTLREEDKDQTSSVKKSKSDDDGLVLPLEEEWPPDEVRLSDSIFMFPKEQMSQHGNVFAGEIRSGGCGIRSCVIKFAEISEQNVREAKILSKLGSHTNVIAIIQSGNYNDNLEDRFYIALDKCHEENLRQYLSNRKNAGIEFDLKQANDFAHQIIDGVAYIHENKVVHLDLKPSNILLSLNQRLVKIADFGLSRELKSTSTKFLLKSHFGTDGYRPVESFGEGWVSLRSDIFSLGAVFSHLLSNGEEVFGNDMLQCNYNVTNSAMDTSGLLVTNPKTTEHLIKLMLSNERCCRPTIWQVAEHPCWTGEEVECNFDYGYGEEIEDSEVKVSELINQEPDDSTTNEERNRQFFRAMRQMGFIRDIRTVIVVTGTKPSNLIALDLRERHPSYFDVERFEGRNIAVTSMAGNLYLICNENLFEFSSYGNWEERAKIPWREDLDVPNIVTFHDEIYLIRTDKMVSYLPIADAWSDELPGCQLPSGFCSATSDKFIYAVGGRNCKRAMKYHLETSQWGEIPSTNRAREHSAAATYRGKLYVAGRSCQKRLRSKCTNSVECYDPLTESWNYIANMRKMRYNFSLLVYNKNLYAVGGARDRVGNRFQEDTVEIYDEKSNEWIIVTEMDPLEGRITSCVCKIDVSKLQRKAME